MRTHGGDWMTLWPGRMLVVFNVAIFIMCICGCATSDATVDRIIEDIKSAKSPEDERSVFQEIERRSGANARWGGGIQVGFQAFDQQGQVVDYTHDKWWELVDTMCIMLNDKEVDHVLIDPENIDLLMHE